MNVFIRNIIFIYIIVANCVTLSSLYARSANSNKSIVKKTSTQSKSVANEVPAKFPDQNKEFTTLVNQSNKFDSTVGKFPTKNNKIAVIAGQNQNVQKKIVEHAKNTYLLLHKDVRRFVDDFLKYKKEKGSEIEKKLYATMNAQQFMMRLLEQRPLMFMTESDRYLLRSNTVQGNGGFETIGTKNERSPLILKDYLSYDEMGLAALIGVSVPTYFINNGARDNQGTKGANDSYEKEGIYAGLVGARFEKPGYMEWQHILITPEQNTQKNGYGLTASNQGLLALWSNVYGEKFPTFEEAKKDTSGRYILLNNGSYFDKIVYKKRMRLVVEPFLNDANKRATQNKKAYVHIVGLGLGVWQIDERQAQYMLDACAQVIQENTLPHISDIDFSWFDAATQQYKDKIIQVGRENNINIIFSKRNPADKLTGNNSGKLIVACYAWDGNSYPGNEYWAGMLTASGDPAAACCSTIAELQNPMINHYIKDNSDKMMSVGVGKKNTSVSKKKTK
jgi:hypothetical protein